MAITFDAISTGKSNSTASLTVAHTCTGTDRILIVQTMCNGAFTTGVTYNGVAMTLLLQDKDGGGGGSGTGVYYLLNPDSGTNNIVASLSTNYIVLTAVSYAGVSQISFPDNSSKENYPADNGATQTNTITPNVDGCWVVGGAFVNATASTTAGTGTTVRVSESNPAGGLGMGDNGAVITPATATSLNFVSSSAGRFGWIASMLEGAVAPTSNISTFAGVSQADVKEFASIVNADTKTLSNIDNI